MNLITVDNITKSYTERLLFENASFYLQEGEKVGVLGINGTGKSTLLKIIAGEEEPDEGQVIRANHIVIRYLSQVPHFVESDSVLECVMRGNVTKENQWSVESEAKTMLTKLEMTDYGKKVGELSGGQKKRLALISVLLAPADILILDEPTNHLDNEMADWLEGVLKNYKGTIIMVTHDRYFLDSVSNRIVEIDKGKIYSYQTNYSGYLQSRAEREEMEVSTERKRQSILKKEIAWMMRGARARSTKQKAHIARYEKLAAQGGIDISEKLQMSSISSRMGKTTIELDQICKKYDDKQLIDHFSYIFLKNDRVGFLGRNGCGKTTLMKIIAGIIQPDEGNVIWGQTIKIGYYTQEISTERDAGIAYMNPEDKVIDYIRKTAEYVMTPEGSISASSMLERFLFPASQQYSPICKLSGGERRRLNLLRVLMESPNVLILDEPTNDLDVETLTILEDYLDFFDGIVIVVSHDRYFLDRIVRRIFVFDEGKIKQYEGNYTDYSIRKQEEENSKKEVESRQDRKEQKELKETDRVREKKLKFSYNEQREYETIEETIAALEEEIQHLEQLILNNATDFVKLAKYTMEKECKEKELEEKMERWEYLEELAAKIREQ